MRSISVRLPAIALLLLPHAALADEPIATTRDIWAPADSCDYYEHSEFGGEVGNIAWDESYIYVGDRWNDRISSMEVVCN